MHPHPAYSGFPRRRDHERRHPLGRARRRWPQAFARVPDEAEPAGGPGLNPRYRGAFERERRRAASMHLRRRAVGGLEQLRRSPARNGLIGLAVVGAAVPIVAHRHQEALRTDPSHAQMLAEEQQAAQVTDDAVTARWQGIVAEAEANPELAQRESVIQDKLERYREYGISRQLAEDIFDAASAVDIDPDVAFGLVRAESSFRNTATSPVGATGLTQLMPRTAAYVEPGTTVRDLRDQKTNLRIGFKYLNQLLEKYNGNEDLALLAYNRGPGTVDRALKRGQNPDNGYARFVRGEADHGHKLFTR